MFSSASAFIESASIACRSKLQLNELIGAFNDSSACAQFDLYDNTFSSTERYKEAVTTVR